MKTSFFDLRDLAGVARASIPWTPVIVIPSQRHNLVRRNSDDGRQEPDLYIEYMSAVQVARAARAVYFAEAVGKAAGALKDWYRSLRGLDPARAAHAPNR
jgi:hypothetical protein